MSALGTLTIRLIFIYHIHRMNSVVRKYVLGLMVYESAFGGVEYTSKRERIGEVCSVESIIDALKHQVGPLLLLGDFNDTTQSPHSKFTNT